MNAVDFLVLKGFGVVFLLISMEGIQVIGKSITYAKCKA